MTVQHQQNTVAPTGDEKIGTVRSDHQETPRRHFLRVATAAVATAFSSVTVVANANRLRYFKPKGGVA